VKVSLAPLVTDLPIVVASLLAFSCWEPLRELLPMVALAGGAYLGWLGLGCWRASSAELRLSPASPGSLRKALWINWLNPHVYLFWATVGAPVTLRAAATSPLAPYAFLGGFYGLLCGSKATLAWALGRFHSVVAPSWYRRLLQVSSALLMVFGAWLLSSGLEQLWHR